MNGRFTLLALLVVAGIITAWALRAEGEEQVPDNDGRLSFRAHTPTRPVTHGRVPLQLGGERDGFLYVPRDNKKSRREPLLILLHGATQRSRLFERLAPIAESLGVVILAPDSREFTWDAIRGKFGPDIEFLDRAIMRAFDRAFIDPCKVVIGGFSDGASYAISLGIRNAKSLRGVVAFSPGFVIPAPRVEKVPVFMRHGTQDEILPIDRTSRPLQAALTDAGFTVDYEEFDGPHTVRSTDARVAMRWAKGRSCESGQS